MSENGVHIDLDEAMATLLGLQSELCRKVGKKASVSPRVPDQLDTVSDNRDRAIEVAENNLAYKKLRLVLGALIRLNEGRYTECEKCEETIADKRLLAVPWAKFCKKCQEEFDRENGFPSSINGHNKSSSQLMIAL